MPRRRRTSNCERCGRRIQLCRFNAHHQKYCSTPDCKAERKRERQRKSYQKRYASDEAFRSSEQRRCREAIAARRSQSAEHPASAPPIAVIAVDVELMATGMLAQMIDSNDPAEVLASARGFEQRGQLLTLSTESARASPK
jgi:hypothetical protein